MQKAELLPAPEDCFPADIVRSALSLRCSSCKLTFQRITHLGIHARCIVSLSLTAGARCVSVYIVHPSIFLVDLHLAWLILLDLGGGINVGILEWGCEAMVHKNEKGLPSDTFNSTHIR